MRRNKLFATKATENTTPMTTDFMLARTVMQNAYSLWGKRIAAVPISLMKLDMSYQRTISANVKKLMAEWDNGKCNFLLVSYRDGYFYVLDGQHRMEVAKSKGLTELPCEILTNLTREEEALIFARQNRNVTKLNPFDTYKANLACGNPEIREVYIDMEIARICGCYNVEVKKIGCRQENPKTLRSISRARQIVDNNGSGCFSWILSVITSSNWNMCAEAYTKEMMVMLRNYYMDNLARFPKAEEELLKVINTTTPMELMAMANYEFGEYAKTAALDLCLKELTRKNRITVAK